MLVIKEKPKTSMNFGLHTDKKVYKYFSTVNIMFNKKGLSQVVTTVLIILLVLAAIVIIWAFVRPAIQSGAGQVSGGCITLGLAVLKCETQASGIAGQYNASVQVERGADDVNLQEIIIILENGDGTSTTHEFATEMSVLETKTYLIANRDSDPAKATVTGRILSEADEKILCEPTALKIDCQ